MKKLNRLSVSELANKVTPFGEDVLTTILGGGDGSVDSPYSVAEMESMMSAGTWYGGCVDGMGYVGGGATIFGYSNPDQLLYGYYTTPYEYGDNSSINFFDNLSLKVLETLNISGGTEYLNAVRDYIHNELYGMGIPAHQSIYVEKLAGYGVNDIGTIRVYDTQTGNELFSFDTTVTGAIYHMARGNL